MQLGRQRRSKMGVMRASSEPQPTEEVQSRRPYDITLRSERAAETRERIVVAGSDLLHRSSVRDWRALTIREVAQRAGVNERTVYRHFGNERGLRDAVMHRIEDEAGIDLSVMQLEDIATVTSSILEHVSSYPLESRPPLDPTLTEASHRQRQALLDAVAARADGWSPEDQSLAAAMFDVLWSVASYERLVVDWRLDRQRAIRDITWVIGLVEQAVRAGIQPPT
jgi:AcrR family transcriptional regulator